MHFLEPIKIKFFWSWILLKVLLITKQCIVWYRTILMCGSEDKVLVCRDLYLTSFKLQRRDMGFGYLCWWYSIVKHTEVKKQKRLSRFNKCNISHRYPYEMGIPVTQRQHLWACHAPMMYHPYSTDTSLLVNQLVSGSFFSASSSPALSVASASLLPKFTSLWPGRSQDTFTEDISKAPQRQVSLVCLGCYKKKYHS